jgi:hypothetical protein
MARCNDGAYTAVEKDGVLFGGRVMERHLSAILAADVVAIPPWWSRTKRERSTDLGHIAKS